MEGDNLGAEDNILQVLSQQHPFPQFGRSLGMKCFVIESAEAVEVGELCENAGATISTELLYGVAI